MSASASSNQFLYFIILIAAVVVIRMRRIIRGTRASVARTIGYTALYLVLAGFVISTSYIYGVQIEYFGLDFILLVGGTFWAFRHSGRRLVFWKQGDGIYVKGATIIYVIYVVGLIARLVIEYLFLPNFGFSTAQIAPTLSSAALAATIATDLLLSFGVGLLIGRNMQILKRYHKIESGVESAPDSPKDLNA